MAESADLVSCILPVFNGRPFLAEAIHSILQQEGPLDIVVIDDGSTDGSAELAARYPGVRVLRQVNAGLAAARNAGLAAARGDLLAFLDADDLWLPGKIARQRALLCARPDVDLCFSLMRHIAVDGAPVEGTPDSTPRTGRVAQCMMARRRAFDRVGRFDMARRLRADQEWLLRARDGGLVEHVIEEVLVHRRIHGANRSITHDHLLAEEFLAITRGALERRRRQGCEATAVEWWSADASEAKP